MTTDSKQHRISSHLSVLWRRPFSVPNSARQEKLSKPYPNVTHLAIQQSRCLALTDLIPKANIQLIRRQVPPRRHRRRCSS